MYRILLVDDEKMELEALKNYIDWKTLGIDHVDTAKNGKAAYELVLDRQPDIVITDIQMPVMNGYEAARSIRKLPRKDAESIPIIAMTADAFAEDIQRAQDAGMNAHVAKPLNINLLYQVLAHWIK